MTAATTFLPTDWRMYLCSFVRVAVRFECGESAVSGDGDLGAREGTVFNFEPHAGQKQVEAPRVDADILRRHQLHRHRLHDLRIVSRHPSGPGGRQAQRDGCPTRLRSSVLRTFPVAFNGRESTISTRRGTL